MENSQTIFDFAVVGSGIGGSMSAALLKSKGFNVILFEKDANLGGASGSFKHKGFTYNAGATTLCGYEDGQTVKQLFDAAGIVPDITKTDPSIVVLHGDKKVCRHQELTRFLQELQSAYPHPKHKEFWHLVHTMNKDFYSYENYFYTNKSTLSKLGSMFSFLPLFRKYYKYLFLDALTFIKRLYGDISAEYEDFLQSQTLIAAQARLEKIDFLTAALSLAYTFNDNYHVNSGFGKLFEKATSNLESLYTKCEVFKVTKQKDIFKLTTRRGEFFAKNVVLNTPAYDTAKLFEEKRVKSFYEKYKKLDNFQSAFTLYMTLRTDKSFSHHYQIIEPKNFTFAISNSVFVSFSDDMDAGHVSVTASTHTDYRYWSEEYETKKAILQKELFDLIVQKLQIEADEVVQCFSATPLTFERFIGRKQLGGNSVRTKDILFKVPSNDTPFEGVYHVGDTVFAAQGWPGVMSGVKNLKQLLKL